jgi:hypothetical protein
MKITCDQCKKEFERNKCQIEKYKQHFCSKLCWGLSQVDISKGWQGTEKQMSAITAKKTVEHKAKISHSHKGMRPTDETRKKLSESAKKKVITDNHKMNMRLGFQRRIEKQKGEGITFSPRIGLQEKRIIDIFQKFIPYKIIRQKRVDGYFIDGYCPPLNLIIEIDEPAHFKDGIRATELEERDKQRQTYLENRLHCKFIRIPVGYSQ